MNVSAILFGILPLIAFVIIDSVSGVKAGVIAAIIFAVAEFLYFLITENTFDYITLGSALLVVFFGLWSIKAKNPLYIKLQPVVMGAVFGAILLATGFFGEPFLVTMAQKYQMLLPENVRHNLSQPHFLALLGRLSNAMGVGLVIHALAVLFSAIYLSKWWWIVIKGVGLYIILFFTVIAVRFF